MVFAVRDLHKKKARLNFGANFVAKENVRKFPENVVFFYLEHDVKQRRHPKSIKKHSRRCSWRLPFRPQINFYLILGTLEGTPKPAFGTKCGLKVAKKWKRDFIQGSPGVPKTWFSVQKYILVRFYSRTGGPNASSGRILAPESCKSGGSLR